MFSILVLLCSSAFATDRVATISPEFFEPGRTWTWEYYQEGVTLYSVEKYEVIENIEGEVTLEMSTHFPGQGTFKAHHRLRVNIDRCLAAYANRADIKPWSFRIFHRLQNKWIEVEPPTTLAFEEKFNCNPHRHDSREYLTVFRDSSAGELFMHKRWRNLEGSWFMNAGPEAGVLFEKDFNHGAGTHHYLMRFRATTLNESP